MIIPDAHDDARTVALHGATRVRSYGEVDDEYRAATGAVGMIDRGGDAVLRIEGRAAAQMLSGVATGRMPEPAAPTGVPGVFGGAAPRHTVLTPKGKMVADLRLGRDPDDSAVGERYWALLPAAALRPLTDHLSRYLNPRFAKVRDVSEGTARITVVGPEAAALVSRVAFGLRVESHELESLAPGEYRSIEIRPGAPMVVLRTGEVMPVAFDLVLPAADGSALWRRLAEAGVVRIGAAAWESLRIEAGSALYGIDTDENTIPTEAGLETVAIDHSKGCYTGQEVIVRIRDRGHVNRRLRLVRLGEVPTPAPGTELFVEGRERAAAEVRSAAWSPRFGEAVALAYVRREVWDGSGDQPVFVTAGAADGTD